MRVHLDDGEPLDVALEALERLGLGLGDPLPASRRRHLLDADAEARVREAALNLLSYRARTRSELQRKLVGKGHAIPRVDACLDRLEERGLVDDAAVATAFVRDRIRLRPRGTRLLTQELRGKGIDDGVARRVVDDVLDDEDLDENALVRRVLEGWIRRQGPTVLAALANRDRSPEREKARRRLHAYLGRRGFGGAALSHAMDLVSEWSGTHG